MPNLRALFSFIARYRRSLSTLSTVAGFLFHVVLFRTIDLPLIEAILAAHLVIVMGAMFATAMPPTGEKASSLFMRARSVAPLLYQYSTGALLSGFLILYGSSGSLMASLPFLILVLIAAVGNEVVTLEKNLLPFQTTLFALNLILYASLLAPVIMGGIGQTPFLVGAGAALGAYVLFSAAGRIIARRTFKETVGPRTSGAIAVFGLVVFCYFVHVIPPIPLSAKSVAFYHRVSHAGATFTALDEARKPFERFFDLSGVTLHLAEGEPAYVFTAVSAPAGFGVTIVHRWQRYDDAEKAWVTDHTVSFAITGGREGGYRAYSVDSAPAPGKYRVSVETPDGAVIGREYLTVLRVASPVPTARVSLD